MSNIIHFIINISHLYHNHHLFLQTSIVFCLIGILYPPKQLSDAVGEVHHFRKQI